MWRVWVASIFLWVACAADAQTQRAVLEMGAHRAEVEVAADEQTRQLGLMYRSQLAPDQGMVFVYPAPARICMWMRNTLIPLSVAFIDEDGVIINIEDMSPLSELDHCSSRAARYALEMNRGWFVEHGARSGSRVKGVKSLPRN